MKLKKMLSILLIPLVLCSNSYAAYINHHYGEKTEEKFVSEYMNSNSNTVVACFVEYKDFFMMNNPSLHDTLKNCEKNKRIIEKLNKVKYKFGNVKAYLPCSKEVIVELIEIKNN